MDWGCFSSTNFSIIVNGRPWGKIIAKKGIRQEDLLAPFLFTIVGDALSSLVHYCNEKRTIKGFSFGNSPFELTHLSMRMIHFSFLLGMLETWRLGGLWLTLGVWFVHNLYHRY